MSKRAPSRIKQKRQPGKRQGWKPAETRDPVIILFDLENAPQLAWTWENWETNVIEVEQDWFLMSVAWKELGQKKVHVRTLPDYPGYKRNKIDDRALVVELHDVLSKADIIIAHNGDAFDLKKANARFLIHGLDPIPPKKTIDTLKIARRNFKFNSNKLDDLGNYLGVGRKLAHTGKHLWLSCIKGDLTSWKKMGEYNAQDVVLLERVYLKLRPYAPNHPNLNIISRQPGSCPKCGSQRLQKRGYSYTRISEIPRLQCQDCGAWSLGEGMRLDVKVKVR